MTSQFCPQCATPLVLAPIYGRDREHCPACGHIEFHKPSPVVLAIIEHDDRLVLIRRNCEPLSGYWTPPGGYVELGESLEDAVVRESREECGLDIAVDGLVGAYSQAGVRALILAYRAHSIGGEPIAGDDAGDLCLVAPGQLPLQRPPEHGEPIDHWFFGVICDVTAPWRWGRRPDTRIAL